MRQLIMPGSIFLESSTSLACASLYGRLTARPPFGVLVLENFFLYFAFAADAFFIFLVLHSVQWFVSSRLRAYAFRLNSSHLA